MASLCTETASFVPVRESRSRGRDDIDEILSVVIPNMPPSAPPKKNPHSEKAIAQAFDWVKENHLEGMFTTPKVMFKAIQSDILGLAMQIYVDADEEMAAWVCEWYLWMFALDDFLDDSQYFASPERTASLFTELNLAIMWSFPHDAVLQSHLVAIFSSATSELDVALKYVEDKLALARLHPDTTYSTPIIDSEPLLKAFLILWEKVVRSSPRQFALRWGIAVQEYINQNMREIKNRSLEVTPSVEELIVMRRAGTAAYLCMMLVEFCNQIFIPEEVFRREELQNMLLTISDFIGLDNDLASFKKEALIGDINNTVLIIKQENCCSYQEAGTIVFQMLLKLISDLENTYKMLLKVTPTEHLPGVQMYIASAQLWHEAGHEWHCNSIRYKIDQEAGK